MPLVPVAMPHLAPHQVVLAPMVTEKGTHLMERRRTYSFRVHRQATKPQIKQAVAELFDVEVVSVRTQLRKGKPRRFKARIQYTSDWKKAYVTLSENSSIPMF